MSGAKETCTPNKIDSSNQLMKSLYMEYLDKYYSNSNSAEIFKREIDFNNFKCLDTSINFDETTKLLERLLLQYSALENIQRIQGHGISSKNIDHNEADNYNRQDSSSDLSNQDTRFNTENGVPSSEEMNKEDYKKESHTISNAKKQNIIAADLLVELSAIYLEYDAIGYIRQGRKFFTMAITMITFGIFVSSIPFIKQFIGAETANTIIGSILYTNETQINSWVALIVSVIKSITFYGFIMLFVIICIRLGRAQMDQAERLRERRHALRQGRLYIHLRDGEMTVRELQEAFDWEASKGNAFKNLPTEALVPWMTVISETLKAIPEAIKKVQGVKD